VLKTDQFGNQTLITNISPNICLKIFDDPSKSQDQTVGKAEVTSSFQTTRKRGGALSPRF